jgi:hypothetical protein
MSDGFTDDDIDFGHKHPILGPEYSAARSFMERFMMGWEDEHLKPLAEAVCKEVTDRIRDKVWDDFRDYLLMDTETNATGAIREMVECSVRALLSGEKWALERYPFANRHDADKVRAAIAAHIPDEVAKARIADLEKEVAQLRESLEWARR